MGTWSPERVAIPLELAEAVRALTNLTNLNIALPTTAVQRLPPCLQQLYLVLTAEQGGQEGAQATCDLRHLAALNNLTLHCPRQVTVKAQLPAQLTGLQSFHCAVASGGSGLQKVEVTGPVTSWPRLLRSLRCSTQLSELTVSVVGCGHTWQGQEDVVSLVDAIAELQQLPTAPTLRRLSLVAPDAFLTVREGLVSDVVQRMSALQDLNLTGAVDRADVLSLARMPCLAQLTCLQLDLGAGLDDFAAVAVACALRDVQRLWLVGAFQSYAVLPLVAQQLTRLCDLWVQDTGGVCVGAQEMRHLASLTLLHSLSLPVDCTAPELQDFVMSMPHLDGVTRPQLQDSDDFGGYYSE